MDDSFFDETKIRRHLREIPANIVMKPGTTFYLPKLSVKPALKLNNRSEEGKARNFPDPLQAYDSRQREKLRAAVGILKDFECRGGGERTAPGCAMFSLSEKEIIDVTMKFVSNTPVHEGASNSGSCLIGQTVIVVRGKDNLARWESTLREKCGCSVMNHSKLALADRIRTLTAEKSTMFDIVLTTFDALKAADIAIPVDNFGHAITSQVGKEDGWYSSRSGSKDRTCPQSCKQLSVLHRVRFKRVIFIDMLGRKSYIAKRGTARAAAAVALSGDMR